MCAVIAGCGAVQYTYLTEGQIYDKKLKTMTVLAAWICAFIGFSLCAAKPHMCTVWHCFETGQNL